MGSHGPGTNLRLKARVGLEICDWELLGRGKNTKDSKYEKVKDSLTDPRKNAKIRKSTWQRELVTFVAKRKRNE